MKAFLQFRRSHRLLALAVVGLAGVTTACAVNSLLPANTDPSFFTFQLDNDLFNGTDNNYTNGARMSWVSKATIPEEFNGVQKWLEKLSGDERSLGLFQELSGFADPRQLDYKYGFSLTQLMYTPTNRTAPSAPPGERPYAGWLGLGFSLHVQDEHALNTIEFSLGTVGPNSLAHQAQDVVHEARKIDKFLGWRSQVRNEATANLFFTQSRKLRVASASKWAVDGFWEWGFSAGTFRIDAMTGALFRAGWNLPWDFSDPRLSTRSYTHQIWAPGHDTSLLHSFSIYGVGGGRGTVVGHDSTLDGSLFWREHTGASSEWLVGEYYLGAGLRFWHVELSYVDTYRSREFRQQLKGQKYGSITLRIHL